jgi:hypothetical protein
MDQGREAGELNFFSFSDAGAADQREPGLDRGGTRLESCSCPCVPEMERHRAKRPRKAFIIPNCSLEKETLVKI